MTQKSQKGQAQLQDITLPTTLAEATNVNVQRGIYTGTIPKQYPPAAPTKTASLDGDNQGARAMTTDTNTGYSRTDTQQNYLDMVAQLRHVIQRLDQFSVPAMERANDEPTREQAEHGQAAQRRQYRAAASLNDVYANNQDPHALTFIQNSKFPKYLELHLNSLPALDITHPDNIINFLIAIYRVNNTVPGHLAEIAARTSLKATGSSAQILRELAREPALQWDNFKNTLSRHISTRDMLRLKFNRMHSFQSEGQSFRGYGDSLKEAGVILGIPESEIVDLVVTGASPGTRTYFTFAELPTTFLGLEQLTREVENVMSIAARRQAAVTTNQNLFDVTPTQNFTPSSQPRYTYDPYEISDRFIENNMSLNYQGFNNNYNKRFNRGPENNYYNKYRANDNRYNGNRPNYRQNYYRNNNSFNNNSRRGNQYNNNNRNDRSRNNNYNANKYNLSNQNSNYGGQYNKFRETRKWGNNNSRVNQNNNILPLLPTGFQWQIAPIKEQSHLSGKEMQIQNQNKKTKKDQRKKDRREAG